MKAILINPPSQYSRPMPSLGLASLSAYLKAHNHDALLLDLWADPLPDEILKKRISDYKPDLIGITFLTSLYHQVVGLAHKFKLWFPDIIIAAGGPHPSALPREVLEEIGSIDLVVIGEGEITLEEVMNSSIRRSFKHIHGIAFRNGKDVVINPARGHIEDINLLPYPDLQQIDFKKYKSSSPYGWYGLPLMMITSRGCPAQCTFCCKSVYGKSFRTLSPERIVREIKYWKEILPIKEIRFYDDDFTLFQKRVFQLCSLLIEEHINLPWSCTSRVDFLSRGLLAKMKEAGLYLIALGVESSSEKVLKLLKKGYRLEHIRKAFQWCHELNIATLGYFLVGNPGETIEDMESTLRLQKEIKPSFTGWGVLEVFPGSALFSECRNRTDMKLDRESGYRDFYRKDMNMQLLRNFCLKAMLKNYLSVYGARCMLTYLYKTRNFSIINDHLWLKFKNYTPNNNEGKN